MTGARFKRVERCTSAAHVGWLELRDALWPQPREVQLAEMASLAAEPGRFAAFVAYADSGEALGLAEAAIRTDYVNGAQSSPVGFLEGLYVVPHARRKGVARALVVEVGHWARDCGCSELASDAALANTASHAVHRALGFEETERVVFFRRRL
ncbi:MAG TPA: aminoglycoside 6'-N-acetyltransferase [Burkholderiales bacterium]|nr:aminoglycoside 6'-N-acetyltransferase [Burkholderiales bacterium]